MVASRKRHMTILYSSHLNPGCSSNFMENFVWSKQSMTRSLQGLLFSAYSLAQVIALPMLGRLADHVGRRPVCLWCTQGRDWGLPGRARTHSFWLINYLYDLSVILVILIYFTVIYFSYISMCFLCWFERKAARPPGFACLHSVQCRFPFCWG